VRRRGRGRGVVGGSLAVVALWGSTHAAAQPPAAPAPTLLPPVLVTAPPLFSSSSEQLIPGKDFELRPEGRPADVLRLVPGLIISQHQGGGKAEQYLIRGFDADHGTDVALFVDGVPVNMRSHAHGQGYADLTATARSCAPMVTRDSTPSPRPAPRSPKT
jgi:outer membrane receptor for Fe3+-dicitrate